MLLKEFVLKTFVCTCPQTKSHRTRENICSAQELVNQALQRWSQRLLRADNTSAIVISLEPVGTFSEPLPPYEVVYNLQGAKSCSTTESPSNTPHIQVCFTASEHCIIISCRQSFLIIFLYIRQTS